MNLIDFNNCMIQSRRGELKRPPTGGQSTSSFLDPAKRQSVRVNTLGVFFINVGLLMIVAFAVLC